jgi:uncharacterized repeat protein (TIGR02543 family)
VTLAVADSLTATAILAPDTVSAASAAVTVTAAQTYAVTYNGNGSTGGTVPSDLSSPYTSGTTVTVLDNTGSLVKTGYTFNGWNTAAVGSGTSYAAAATFSISANTILYAQWTALPTYTVTYNTGTGGPTVASETVNSGGLATEPTAPTMTGFTFSGWFTDNTFATAANFTTPIAADTTLYADWTPVTYTVSFNTGTGGTPTPTPITGVASGATVTLPTAPTLAGSTFAGWFTAVSGGGTAFTAATAVTGNITVYASWTPDTYTTGLNFSPVSGTSITTSTPIYITASPALSTDEAVYWNTTGPLPMAGGSLYQTGFNLSVSGAVYAAVYDSQTGSWGDQASATYTIGHATVSVASQSGTITAGTAGSATFAATTTNIADGTAVTIGWCDSSGAAAATPPGLSAAGTDVASNTSTITVTADAVAVAGTYCFTATSDGVTSSMVTVTVSPHTIISSGGGGEGGGVTSLYPPSVQTEAASTITATSAVLNGDITSDDGFNITDYGFLWGTSAGSLTNKLDAGTNNQSGAFTDTLSNLTAGTTYYFEAYATNSYGTSDDGAVMSFTAGVQTPTPTVQTEAATSITTDSAVLNGDITSTNGHNITDCGFLWGISSSSLTNTLDVGDNTQSGAFTDTLSNLMAGTTYYFEAYATNSYGTAGGTVMSFTTTTVAAPPPVLAQIFTDVPDSFWAYGDIENLSGLGYVSGYPDGTFRPNNPITRAEFATIMDKVLKLTPYTAQTPRFSDVNTGDWFYQAVKTAVYAGIFKGYGDGTFHPDAPISRQEIACVLVQAMGESQVATSDAHTVTKYVGDRNIAWWSRGYVFVATQQGIIDGYPDNTYKPRKATTRAESCAMVENLLKSQQ